MKILQLIQFKKVHKYIIVVASIAAICLIFSQQTLARTKPWITINNNAYSTKVRKVTLQLWAPEDTIKMKISNTSDFTNVGWEKFAESKIWYLPYGAGQKRVYIQYVSNNQIESPLYSDVISMNPQNNMTVKLEIAENTDEVYSRVVDLHITYTEGVEEIALSNSQNFIGAEWIPVQATKTWTLDSGEGLKTVYMRARDSNENISVVQDTVTLVQPKSDIDVGQVVRSPNSGLYYFGEDGKIHPFLGLHVYHSWYADFNDVLIIPNNRLISYQVDDPVCIKPGTWLVAVQGTNEIYAVEPGCQLWPLRSETEASILYEKKWDNRVLTITSVEASVYTIVDRNNITGVDKDNDGIEADTEKNNGTSDASPDTDRDGVSDFEEIHFWFSDPSKRDSDGDSYTDGDEIQGGFSPSGINKYNKVPLGYEYPVAMFDGNHLFRVSRNKQISIRSYQYSYKSDAPYIIKNNTLIEL